MLGEVAGYLEGRALITQCPDHLAWAELCREWGRLWGHVAALQENGVTVGTIETTGELLAHPDWMAYMVAMASGEVAAGITKATAGIAEFLQSETRRFVAVEAS